MTRVVAFQIPGKSKLIKSLNKTNMQVVEKSEKVDLTKTNPGLTGVVIGCGWNPADTGKAFDLDASVFVLDASNKVITDKHFVYYGNLKSPDGFIKHNGDNLTGEGAGDDEQIVVDFSKAPETAQEVVIVVNIYQADSRDQKFGQVKDAFIRVCGEAGAEILRYDLSEDSSANTAMVFGKLYKHNGEWKFQAIGEGDKKGLQHYSTLYAKA